MLRFRGVPTREIHGLPYSVHQIGEDQWQITIQNCARFPAGYTFAPVYGGYEEAYGALERWPEDDVVQRESLVAGDDTGAVELVRWDDQSPID